MRRASLDEDQIKFNYWNNLDSYRRLLTDEILLHILGGIRLILPRTSRRCLRNIIIPFICTANEKASKSLLCKSTYPPVPPTGHYNSDKFNI